MLRPSDASPAALARHPHATGDDLETEWHGRVPLVTPNEHFFVRNHTRAPSIDPARWRLVVGGNGVARRLELSLAELQRLPTVTREIALECTGNGRRFFAEQQGTHRPGTPWGMGAIGVAHWTGTPLAEVLHRADLLPSATQVMAVGLDAPYVKDGVDHGWVRRPLPLHKALDDVLVVWRMNGDALPVEHGFPVRLLVPGWVGIASIKWLGELWVTPERVDSPWNTRWYRMHGAGWTEEEATLERLPVKSTLDETGPVRCGTPTRLVGRAWAGEASIARVEVSVDGGRTWRHARLLGRNLASSWVRWVVDWTPGRPGTHEVLVRATDSTGRRQPDRARDNDDGYLFDAVLRCPVAVEP